ncbi:hypothetical protein [Ramlibacter alkalitolerans]|uniref:RcnB family protein n=1 Tax=Ramlibacter alkalitolerans TaxID=2039631 RepID=A0ABS1JVA4_9BURK|nr:hypothetical protein [Ramlibacter alkalitolerans]MBL0428243.1 hypothetical protein [Ramlibacter alkalitolerans]
MTPPRPHRLTFLLALLLADAGGAGLALAQSHLPDPVAPAVIGRPLDQIRPVRPARPVTAKKDTRAKSTARAPAPAAQAAARPAAIEKVTAAPAAPAPAQQALAPPGAEPDAPLQRRAKMALDDRADTRIPTDDVGKGTHFARKPLGPGAYFGDKDRASVRKYYEANPPAGTAPHWEIGQSLPAGVPIASVPKPVMAALPKLPPGHRYVQLGGDILLVAAGSKMVVDGISVRAGR